MVDIRAKIYDGLTKLGPKILTGIKLGSNVFALDVVLRGSDGTITDLSNIELILPTPLKADVITSIGITDANVAQTGILKANLFNSGNTTIYVWFGEAVATGKKITIRPGGSWNESVDNKSSMHYQSDVAGGQLDYVLLG